MIDGLVRHCESILPQLHNELLTRAYRCTVAVAITVTGMSPHGTCPIEATQKQGFAAKITNTNKSSTDCRSHFALNLYRVYDWLIDIWSRHIKIHQNSEMGFSDIQIVLAESWPLIKSKNVCKKPKIRCLWLSGLQKMQMNSELALPSLIATWLDLSACLASTACLQKARRYNILIHIDSYHWHSLTKLNMCWLTPRPTRAVNDFE